MDKQKYIDGFIDSLIKNGAEKKQIQELKQEIERHFNDIKDKEPIDIIKPIIDEIRNESINFLADKNEYDMNYIYSLSSCIYLPDYQNNGYKIKFIDGTVSRENKEKIDENTLFDIASVTKMFTLLLTFKLIDLGYLNLNDKIVDLCPEYPGLEDFTIEDLLLLRGQFYTKGNIATTKDNAEEILKTIYLTSNDRTTNTYTDFGAIIIGKTIETVINKKHGTNLNYGEILNKYILEPYGLVNTTYFPKVQITGNGSDSKFAHDPKSNNLGHAVGSAGLFTNSEDLAKLAFEIFRVDYVNYDAIVSKENLLKMGTIPFPNGLNNKGYLGLYQKHVDDNKTYVPSFYANTSFAHQGWTGPVAIFDPINQIHNSILTGAIKQKNDPRPIYKNEKPIGYMNRFNKYKDFITLKSMSLLAIKKYFDLYDRLNNTVDIQLKKH